MGRFTSRPHEFRAGDIVRYLGIYQSEIKEIVEEFAFAAMVNGDFVPLRSLELVQATAPKKILEVRKDLDKMKWRK
jgi:hypothetical protein